MHVEQRRGVSKSLKVVAIGFVLAGQLLFAGAGGKGEEAAPPPGPASVAVVPFVLDGKIDEDLSTAFLDHLSSREGGWKVVDGASVAQKLPKGAKFASNTPVESLLKAAKAAGAEAVILGKASRYKVLDAPGIRLQVSMLGVEAGDEIHSAMTEASGWTSQRAKREAGKTASKTLLKDLGRD